MIRPITDRMIGAHMTYVDMDRIAKNLNELAVIMNARGYYIKSSLKTRYHPEDILTKAEWDSAVAAATDIAVAINFGGGEVEISDDFGLENLNNIESLTLEAYLMMARMLDVVSGDGITCGLTYEGDPVIETHNIPKLPTTIYDVSGDGLVSGDTRIGGDYER